MKSRNGFSFTEILFAIMILGIGFIMVAAMFPVAIQQTQTSKSETVGASMARSGVAVVQSMANASFVQIKGGSQLCLLRPTVQFPGMGIFADQDLFNSTQPNPPSDPTKVALPQYTIPGTYLVNGEVWDFCPISPKGFGAESVIAVGNGTNVNALATPESLSALLVSMTSQNMVQAADRKYAWVAFYKRDLIETVTSNGAAVTRTLAYAPTAQVIIIATQARNAQQYQVAATSGGPPYTDIPIVDPTLIPPPANPNPPSLEASRSVSAASILSADSGHLDAGIAFTDPVQDDGKGGGRAAEGAFVIVAADFNNVVPYGSPLHGALNGRIYRLGAFNGDRWSFAPGYGPSASDLSVIQQTSRNKFAVYLIGKGLNQDGNAPTYSGLAQDVAVYSTFISVGQN